MPRRVDRDRIVSAQLSGSAWRLSETSNDEAVRELAAIASRHSDPRAALEHAESYYRNRLAAKNIYPDRAETAIRLLEAAKAMDGQPHHGGDGAA